MRATAAVVLAFAVGCTRAATPTHAGDAAVVTVTAVPTPSGAPAKDTTDAAAIDPRRWAAVGASGSEVALLPNDELVEDTPGRFVVRRSASVSVTLWPTEAAAPSTIPEIGSVYGADAETHRLGSGTTADGAQFALRSFRVRVGHSGIGGQIVHGFARVARAESILPVDSSHHVKCTGYVEHDVTEVTDPDFDWVAKICLSLRKKR